MIKLDPSFAVGRFCIKIRVSSHDPDVINHQTSNLPNPEMVTLLEHCRIGPPSAAAEVSLPVTFFDMIWLYFHPIQRLLFYEFSCSNSHFLETIVPNLKASLSLTLKHFTPLAGNLVHPLIGSSKPVFQYKPGDSVSLTIAEANEAFDFNYLTGNQPRDSDDFYGFVPELPPEKIELDSKIIPLLALQVTLFPNAGICIGFTNHHSIGDASSIVGFIKAWSSVTKFVGDEQFLSGNSLPFYDRSVIKDPSGLATKFWNQMSIFKIESLPLNFPTNKVRATYILLESDIKKLKDLVIFKRPTLVHASSFTVTTAYVWTCLVKATAATTGDETDGEGTEYFAFAVDARRRLNPPAPPTYFGNCLGLVYTESTHEQLKGNDGFLIAAELIGELISKKVNNKEEILKDAENWISYFGELLNERISGVAGSPKFDLYDTDYGWGNPKKFESVSIDGDGSMSLCKSREFEGGLEIGLSLSKPKMDAFAPIFFGGLHADDSMPINPKENF